MTYIKEITRKELTSQEVLEIVNDGGRVVIELSVMGKSARVVIRRHEGTYYCDTPMLLMRHETEEALRDCLERYRLTRSEEEATVDGTPLPA